MKGRSVRGEGRLFDRKRGAELALIGVTVIWGLTFVFTKKSLHELEPFVFLAWRFAIAFGAMALLCIPRYSKMSRGVLGAGALLGTVLFSSYAFQTFGLEHTSAGNAGFITGLFIVFTPLLAWAFLGQKQSLKAVLAVALALAGLALLSLSPGLSVNPGDAMVLVCAFSYSVHIILLDRYAGRYDISLLTLVQMGTLFALNTGAGFAFETVRVPATGYVWMSLAVCGVLASALAFYIQAYAQRVLSPTRTSMVLIMEPVFSLAFGMILLGERLGPRGWVGCALILAGMVVTELPSRAPGEPPGSGEDGVGAGR